MIIRPLRVRQEQMIRGHHQSTYHYTFIALIYLDRTEDAETDEDNLVNIVCDVVQRIHGYSTRLGPVDIWWQRADVQDVDFGYDPLLGTFNLDFAKVIWSCSKLFEGTGTTTTTSTSTSTTTTTSTSTSTTTSTTTTTTTSTSTSTSTTAPP